MTTVKELKEILDQYPDNTQIFIASDEEGNSFAPLAHVDGNGILMDSSSHDITIYSATWTADEAAMDEEEWEKILEEPRVIVIWP